MKTQRLTCQQIFSLGETPEIEWRGPDKKTPPVEAGLEVKVSVAGNAIDDRQTTRMTHRLHGRYPGGAAAGARPSRRTGSGAVDGARFLPKDSTIHPSGER